MNLLTSIERINLRLPHMTQGKTQVALILESVSLGGVLKPAQSAGDQVLTPSLTYLLGLETICSLCISVSGKPIVPELRSGFPL